MERQEQISALRKEIRRSGAITSWFRLAAAVALAAVLVGGTAHLYHVFNTAYVHAAAGPEEAEPMFDGIFTALFGFPGSVVASLTGAWVAALIYRETRIRQLRRYTAALSPQQRHAALLPLLRTRRPDTREIARALHRTGGPPTEMTPSTPGDGRGDEPVPVDAL